jgi:hypothetical protein
MRRAPPRPQQLQKLVVSQNQLQLKPQQAAPPLLVVEGKKKKSLAALVAPDLSTCFNQPV